MKLKNQNKKFQPENIILASPEAKVTRKYKLCNTAFMAAMFGPDSLYISCIYDVILHM